MRLRSRPGPGPSVNDRTALVEQLRAFLDAGSLDIFGGADIYSLNPLHPHERAGMLAAVLATISTVDRRPAVRELVIVVPAGTEVEDARSRAWAEMLSSIRHLTGREMVSEAQDRLGSRFSLIAAADGQSRSVLDIISVQPHHSAVIVTEAASYRDVDVEPYVAPGASTPLLPQDIWAPQIHALAARAVELARERMLYVALDTNQLSPSRWALAELLTSIDHCGVLGSSNDQDVESMLSARADRWDARIREGRLGEVLREIEELPSAFDGQKPYFRIQMLHRAGLSDRALDALRQEITRKPSLDPPIRVKLARIAQDGNATRLAVEVLSPAVDDLDNLEDLEGALATAVEAGSRDLEHKIAARLTALFPDSRAVRRRLVNDLLGTRDYTGVAALLANDPDDVVAAEFYGRLAQFLSGAETPDYRALVASAGSEVARVEAFRMACVSDALKRQLVIHAFAFVLPIPNTPALAEQGERLLLQVLEALLLVSGKGRTSPIDNERLVGAVLALIERLAGSPTNQMLRVGIARLMQPNLAGTMGLAIMGAVLIELAARPLDAVERDVPGTAGMDWLLARKTFLNEATDWLRHQSPVVIGRVALPDELVTEPADDIVSAVTEYLSFAPVASEDDATSLQFWLALGAAVTPHSSDPDFDLRLMRLVAGKLASSGYPQLARDLAEQALLNSTATRRRCRLGWFVAADAYHRCHNHLEAFIALACALAADTVGDEEQIWQEIYATARLLRDCGLHAHARSAIARGHQLLGRMGLSNTHGHRLDTLELQIRQTSLGAPGSGDSELEALLADAVRNGAAVLEHGDMTEPAATLLGQLLRSAKGRRLEIPSGAGVLFAKLRERVRGNFASIVDTASADTVSASQLLDLLRMGGAARYSDDVGYDMHTVAIAAARALADDRYVEEPIDTAFALELLSDRGVAVPGWDEAAEPPPAPSRVDEPADIARSISSEGLSIVQAAFDSEGRLVRMSAVAGRLQDPVREPDEAMHEGRLKEWAVKYPFEYGVDESTPNLFYTTTAELRLSALPDGPVVMAVDAALQAFPPNLLFVDDDFAGRTRPIAAVPSLSWFYAARARGAIGDGRLCAWISTAVGGSGSETLPMIAERLQPTFAKHGVAVDHGPTLPATFAGATMAIVTAHGGVHPEGRYFQVVSDEGLLRVTPGDLAGALRNVGTVVLFVCSGGRADKHPGAQTTIGLAKQILDRGCQAVVASPWPLDARVPSHWLPVFLEHWSQGERLIEANFAANKVVDRTFAKDPARGLAMTVMGNPSIRRP